MKPVHLLWRCCKPGVARGEASAPDCCGKEVYFVFLPQFPSRDYWGNPGLDIAGGFTRRAGPAAASHCASRSVRCPVTSQDISHVEKPTSASFEEAVSSVAEHSRIYATSDNSWRSRKLSLSTVSPARWNLALESLALRDPRTWEAVAADEPLDGPNQEPGVALVSEGPLPLGNL